MSYQQLLKLAKNSGGRDAIKTAGKVVEKKGFLKEFILSPQFPRLLILAIGGASALGFYLKNGSRNDAQKKKEEPLGDIKIENLNERLAKYAISMEVALSPNGKENLKVIRDTMETYNQLGLNFQDISREQLTAFQTAETVRKNKIATIAYERLVFHMNLRSKYYRATTGKEKGTANESALFPTAVIQLTPGEEKILTDLAIRDEKADLEFWSSVLMASTPEQRKRLSLQAAKTAINERGSVLPHSFLNLSSYLSPNQRPHVFVLKFDGNLSQIGEDNLIERYDMIDVFALRSLPLSLHLGHTLPSLPPIPPRCLPSLLHR